MNTEHRTGGKDFDVERSEFDVQRSSAVRQNSAIAMIVGAVVFLALFLAGILSWSVSLVALLLSGGLAWVAWRDEAAADPRPRFTPELAFLLILVFALLTLLPLPLPVSRIAGSVRYEQNRTAAAAIAEAEAAGLVPRQAHGFAMTRSVAGTMRIAGLLIAAFGAAALASRLSPGRRRVLLGLLAILGTCIGAAGIVSLRVRPQGDTLWWVYPIPHFLPGPVTCFVNRNHFAGFMAMLCPVALALALGSLGKRRWLAAAAWLLPLAIMTAAVALTRSRGAFLAWLAGIAVVPACAVPLRRSLPWLLAGALLAGAGGVLMLRHSPQLRERIEMLRTPGEDQSVNARLAAWRDSLIIWKAHPLTGAGLNAFRTVYPMYRTTAQRPFRSFAENEYVQLLAEGGLLGFGLFLLAGVACADAALKRVAADASLRLVLAACCGAAAATAVHALAEFSLHVPLYAVAFGGILGSALPPPRAGAGRRRALPLLGAAAAAVFLLWEPQIGQLGDENKVRSAAEKDAGRALAWAPTFPAAWERLGRVAEVRRTPELTAFAGRCFAQAARCDPNNYRLWMRIGQYRLDTKDYSGAREAFARVVQLRPWMKSEIPKVPEK